LIFLAKHFPRDFPASVLVTIHLPRHGPSSLDEILSRAGPSPAAFATDNDILRKGRIYIAPPDRHLIVDNDRLSLGEGPRENNARPAIDPMFRSAASCCGPRSIGVVLTGTLGDGASGLWAVGQCGGMTVVQDPEDAEFAEMPLTALNRAKPDHIVGLAQMPDLLGNLVQRPAGEARPVPRSMRYEVEIARGGYSRMSDMDGVGRRSVLACPDCGGVMWEIDEDELVRFRCHVGHTYTAEVMSLTLDENLRRALASALRALEERVALARKLEGHRQRPSAPGRELGGQGAGIRAGNGRDPPFGTAHGARRPRIRAVGKSSGGVTGRSGTRDASWPVSFSSSVPRRCSIRKRRGYWPPLMSGPSADFARAANEVMREVVAGTHRTAWNLMFHGPGNGRTLRGAVADGEKRWPRTPGTMSSWSAACRGRQRRFGR
jgi:two-component system chemotaxis response regulator CheB